MSDLKKRGTGSLAEADAVLVDADTDPGLLRKIRSLFTHFQPTKIELHHVSANGGGTVMMWNKDAIAALIKDGPELMARDVHVSARDDANSYIGLQRYAMLTFVEASKQPLLYKFNVQGGAFQDSEDGGNDLFEGGEGPNPKGVLAMMMRQNNESQKLAVHASANMLRIQQQTIDRYAAQHDQLWQGMSKVVALIQDLSDRQFERDMKREDKLMIRDTVKTVAKAGADALPSIMMRFAPSASNQTEQLLFNFVGKVGEERLGAWIQTLPEEEQQAFLQLYSALQARQNGGSGGNAPPSTGA